MNRYHPFSMFFVIIGSFSGSFGEPVVRPFSAETAKMKEQAGEAKGGKDEAKDKGMDEAKDEAKEDPKIAAKEAKDEEDNENPDEKLEEDRFRSNSGNGFTQCDMSLAF